MYSAGNNMCYPLLPKLHEFNENVNQSLEQMEMSVVT